MIMFFSKIKCSRKNFEKLIIERYLLILFFSQIGCGKSNKIDRPEDVATVGFPLSYSPPAENYTQPESIDPNFKKLSLAYNEPYWVSALMMDDGEKDVSEILLQHDNILFYSFPSEAPSYLPVSISGWSPANEKMKLASREIFQLLRKY